MSKRIISISSGKGGVGKTSFAINLALSLSRHGKTVLLDLDTGTSSIRNVIDAPVRYDLYHFFKKNRPLGDCVTTLGKLDKGDQFNNFGYVASPKHLIDAIANMDQGYRERMIEAVNELDADYVILDLKAGIDAAVLDFLPQSNTGILVFTPNHPAATLAASDITKALLFRKLRSVFGVGSPVYDHLPSGVDARLIHELLDQAEDVYEEEVPNLDHFIERLGERLPEHPVLRWIVSTVEYFRVYYVLNRFDHLESGFETAIKPFVENIANNVSARVSISNLGWVMDSERYHQANTRQVPFLLEEANAKVKPKKVDRVAAGLEELYQLTGLRKEKPSHKRLDAKKRRPDAREELENQFRALETMFQSKSQETLKENFDYIVSSMRYLFQGKRVSDFGDVRLFKQGELVHHMLAKSLK